MRTDILKSNKILFVHQGFELYGSDKMLLLNIKAASIKYPEKKIVVVLPKRGMLSEILEKEYKVEVLFRHLGVIRKYDLKRFNFSALMRIFTFFRLLAFINAFEFVYINSIVIIDYMLAARFAKVKVFIHVHELPLGVAAKIFSMLLSFSRACLIFISSASKNAYTDLKNKQQHIVWNGAKPLKALLNEKGDNNKIKILMIGRINSWKGQPLLVNAIALLNRTEQHQIEVQIVGDVFMNQQALKIRLQEQINKKNLQQIIKIFPFTSTPELYYNWSDVVIVPSILPEPFGLVAIEAKSLGKLVIAANHGGLKEIIEDKVNGLLFEPGNEMNLAEKISEIIKDRNTINKLGKNAVKNFNDNFSEEIYIDKLKKII